VDTIPDCELSRAQGRVRGLFVDLDGAGARSGQRQNLHGRVVVVEHLPLRRLTDQLFVSGPDQLRGFGDDLPLRRGRQRNPQVPLQPRQPVEGMPLPYFSNPIIAAALSSYFFSPTPSGASAS